MNKVFTNEVELLNSPEIDILASLADDETNRIMRRLENLQMWLITKCVPTIEGTGTALDICQDARSHIISRRLNQGKQEAND